MVGVGGDERVGCEAHPSLPFDVYLILLKFRLQIVHSLARLAFMAYSGNINPTPCGCGTNERRKAMVHCRH